MTNTKFRFPGFLFLSATLLVLVMLVSFTVSGQEMPKVYIVPMEDGFETFLAAAFIKKEVPITMTLEEEAATYIIIGSTAKGTNKWYDTVFGSEKDRNQGSIRLIRKEDKSVEWAATAGDKSRWFVGWKKGGKEKVANRLAKKLKKHFSDKAKKTSKEKS